MKMVQNSLLLFALAALSSAGCSEAPVEVTTSAAAAEIVNTKCPIMGHEIDTADLDPSLMKDWNGKKVAFCCPPCLEEWDELTEAEKAEKIAQPQSGHDHTGHSDAAAHDPATESSGSESSTNTEAPADEESSAADAAPEAQ